MKPASSPRSSRPVDPIAGIARSSLMARVKSKGNRSTELVVARALRHSEILGWRRHVRNLPSKPDFYFPAARVALFVHGCFWHGCPKCYRAPKGPNAEFWRAKVAENMRRDARVARQLRHWGIGVVTVWEHELSRPLWLNRLQRRLARVARGGPKQQPSP